MKLGTIIAIAVILVGCGIASTRMMSVGVPREAVEDAKRKTDEAEMNAKLEEARKRMQQMEKAAKFERHYPAPVATSPNKQSEPIGGGSRPPPPPPVIEQKPALSIEHKENSITTKLFNAALAFVIPDKANINEEIKAQLLINPNKEVSLLEKDLTKKGVITGKEIKVSRVVKATLTAPDFKVTNITDEEQLITDNESTEWLWALSPKESGKYDVNLSVTAIITIDGKEAKHHLKTFEKTITIDITPEQLIENWFDENWKWIISTLIIPLLAFLFKDKVKKLLVG